MKRFFASAVLGLGILIEGANAQVYVRIGPPPPPPREVVTVRPGPRYVWVPGYQRWDGNRYAWAPGSWAVPPPHRRAWVPGRWRSTRRGYVWVDGRWR